VDRADSRLVTCEHGVGSGKLVSASEHKDAACAGATSPHTLGRGSRFNLSPARSGAAWW